MQWLQRTSPEKHQKLDIGYSIKEILLEFSDVFEERVGKLEGELTFQTEPDAVPIQPIRSVTGRTQLMAQQLYDRKKTQRKAPECLDPKPLNKTLINNYHCHVPSLEFIIHKFANKKAIKFSKLDVRSGFFYCKLNDMARELTVFGTAQGNSRYKRLLITPTSKAFQAKMIEQFKGVNGVSIIQDDCLVEGFGNNSDHAINNHNQKLRAYLQKHRERNVKINHYMGHTLTNAGLKPDKEKVRAITEFPAPHDLHHLKHFIGIVKYLSKFDHFEPLNKLTWKDQVFQCPEVQ